MRIDFEIKTKRATWKVLLEHGIGVLYYVNNQYVPKHQVPVSIKKRARCVIKNPKRFGKRVISFYRSYV